MYIKKNEFKTMEELMEIIAYRIWLTKMGLHETYDILFAGSDAIYS
ncbi:hypothetical protein LCGC14_1618980 [marine sediment metagenome]|uniref:Uncharacterized protein n=1 Tax=marine sediment metagenome TaxID=412755 RepID=A0A0F9I639_9ZZZZ